MIQGSVTAWVTRNFPGGSAETQALNIAEETGELCRAVLKRQQGIRGSAEAWSAEVQREAADLVISLYALAGIEGFDLDAVVRDRWSHVETRDWVRDPIGHGIAGQA